ncbi:MAG: hypothetical protein A2073_08015 [Deltaproteobacteria bacterium GWC2_42_11]|nr:MAG: hypothetical protein A2073_08015 [Deltaproteobacteria bacterium GWC2_42_11]HBO85312.1 hypothetical protein [Deltaproteobacteria bacterium]
MPEQKMNIKIPKHSIIYLLVCLSGVLVFIVLGIIPNSISLAGFDKKIKETRSLLQEQKNLLPIYQTLIKDIESKKSPALPMPEKSAISKGDSTQIFETFRELAKKSGLETLSIVPDLKSLSDSSKSLSVSMAFKGEYFDFRNLLMHISEIPYLEHIELIDIQQTPDAKEFRIKVWLSLT